MMGELGEVFGFLIIMFYALAVLDYIMKYLNRNYRDVLKKKEDVYKIYMNLMKLIIKYHRYFGGLAILMILIHFLIMFRQYGISTTGGIAAGVMLLQVGLGIYGQLKKARGKVWLWIHRGVAVAIPCTILIHVI